VLDAAGDDRIMSEQVQGIGALVMGRLYTSERLIKIIVAAFVYVVIMSIVRKR
jgi:hypothetical protein